MDRPPPRVRVVETCWLETHSVNSHFSPEMRWSWAGLAAALGPPAAPQQAVDPGPATMAAETDRRLRFHRERNGWCLSSSQIWLALEYKGIDYTEVRELQSTTPMVQWPDGSSVQFDSVEILRQMDRKIPDAPPLWPPAGVEAKDVDAMVQAFTDTMPRARADSRAGYLFCADEGFTYDVLSRETFIATLDATEELLSRHPAGPYFCGTSLSAADAVWAPVLERYASQLPCLHKDLTPRSKTEWPRLAQWYAAMDSIPVYACRIKGDAPSWRKVLSSAPWWPPGWPSRGGPNERGDPRGGALVATEAEACAAFAGGAGEAKSTEELWAEYARGREGVAPNPGAEAAAALRSNAPAIVRDAVAYCALPEDQDDADYKLAIERVATLLEDTEQGGGRGGEVGGGTEEDDGVCRIVAYLDDRLCVPRDMGVPPAAAIRALHQRLNVGAGEVGASTLKRVSRF